MTKGCVAVPVPVPKLFVGVVRLGAVGRCVAEAFIDDDVRTAGCWQRDRRLRCRGCVSDVWSLPWTECVHTWPGVSMHPDGDFF